MYFAIPALAMLLVLLAWGISNLKIPLRWLTVLLLLTLTANPLYSYYTKLDKEPWRETAKFLEQSAHSGDAIVLCAYYTQSPFQYYFKPQENIKIFAPSKAAEIPVVLDSIPRLWLVQSYDFFTAEKKTSEALVARLQQNHTAAEPVLIHGPADPNPNALWITDIRVTLYDSGVPVYCLRNLLVLLKPALSQVTVPDSILVHYFERYVLICAVLAIS